MFRLFKSFFLSDFGPPPPPDVADRPSFPAQRIIETLYSETKRERAIITVDEKEDFQIIIQRWDISDWKADHQAFWSGRNIGSHSDTIERARESANEALKNSQRDD
jgi:hypothetical protein